MKAKWIAVAFVGIVVITVVAAGIATARRAAPSKATAIEEQGERVSYAVGVQMGKTVGRLNLELDRDAVVRGFADALAGGALALSEEDVSAILRGVQRELAGKQAEAAKADAQTRKSEGEAFLAENAKKEGVVTLPSGLQYKVLQPGHGSTPKDGDAVVCRYRGTLVDGTEFDSSSRRGGPATFRVAKVIPAWKEALKSMPVGSKWQLFVPPELAYGARGAGRKIGPNATLVFEIELLSIQAPTAAGPTAPARGIKAAAGRSLAMSRRR